MFRNPGCGSQVDVYRSTFLFWSAAHALRGLLAPGSCLARFDVVLIDEGFQHAEGVQPVLVGRERLEDRDDPVEEKRPVAVGGVRRRRDARPRAEDTGIDAERFGDHLQEIGAALAQ
jgi:hypothetical protein